MSDLQSSFELKNSNGAASENGAAPAITLPSIPRHKQPKRAAYMRDYAIRNREEFKLRRRKTEYHKKYYAKNHQRLVEYARKWRDKNRAKINEYKRIHSRRPDQREKQYDRNLKYRFGITRQERDALFSQNNGLCHICNKQTAISVDHDHETGKIRGALCDHCNWMIGHAKEDEETLLRAIQYLRKHK